MSKFISVVSPVYNVNKYLDDYLKSFLDWPKGEYEIIIVDDCSPENPRPILEKYPQLNIKYIKNKINLGLGFSRNVAFDSMDEKATHYMILDSDNYLVRNSWNIVKNCMREKPVLSTKLFLLEEETGNLSKIKNRGKISFLKGSGYVGPEVNIIPKEARDVRFTSRSMEDLRWMAELTSKYGYELSREALIIYLIRDGSLSHAKVGTKESIDGIEDYFREFRLAEKGELLILNKEFKDFISILYNKYFYAKKSKRTNNDMYFFNLLKLSNYKFKIIAFFQRTIRFWWWDEKITKIVKRKKWAK